MQAAKFDWLDSSTFENPFQHKSLDGESVAAVYVIAPEVADPVPAMTAFVDHAVQRHGVKRFVLLTGSTVEQGGYNVGILWQHLVDIGVEFCVLRATWFMGALSPHASHMYYKSRLTGRGCRKLLGAAASCDDQR